MLANRFTQAVLLPAPGYDIATRGTNVRLPLGSDLAAGTVLGLVSGGAVASEVKTLTITGTPTGGSFTVTFNGETTVAVAYDATAAALQAALVTLFGTGNVVVTGSAGGPYTVTFGGVLANTRVASFTMANSFTGGTNPTIASVNTTRGSCGPRQADAYTDGASEGLSKAVGVLKADFDSDNYGGNTANESGTTNQAEGAFMYTGGYFLTGQMTGLDAAAVADLGRLVAGTAHTDSSAVLFISG